MPRKNACSSIPSWSWSLTVSYGVDGILMYRLSMESVVNFKYHEKNRILFLSCCASAVSKILKVALASAPPRFMTTGALLKAPLLLVLVLVITLHYSTTLHDDLINSLLMPPASTCSHSHHYSIKCTTNSDCYFQIAALFRIFYGKGTGLA